MTKKILLFLCHGFEAYEASVFTDVIGWSQYYGDKSVELKTAGFKNEIEACWNFKVKPEVLFEDIRIEDYDALAIPGGFEEEGYYTEAYSEEFLDLVKAFNTQGKIIATVCVGAMPLGKCGILKGVKATTYDLFENHRRGQLAEFGADVQDKHVVVSDNIITSTGPRTAIEVALILLEMLTSKENAEHIKYLMRF
jgi:4-methyl-5(b-hydroxyethyl)-thiazole monophosphate biosynthesis